MFGDRRYERLAEISNGHLYNLRRTAGYRRQTLQARPTTRGSPSAIGQRRRRGFLRVDSVRQGDREGSKGVYLVNGRSPLGWFIDRYHIATDKHSKIVNDPNGWFEDDPLELIAAICRIVHVSVETARIVAKLPDPTDTRGEQGRDVELTIGGAEAAASGARPPLTVTDAAGVSSSVPGEKLEASD